MEPMLGLVEIPEGSPQDPALTRALAALAHSNRIALLRQLRTPKTLREIEVRITTGEGDAERKISRQAVREHLDRLLEIGVVQARETERPYGETVEYSLNHQTLFAIAEAFRSLARMRPTAEPDAPTVRRSDPPQPFRIQGPCLVLVKGLDEGRTFALAPPASGRREWVIGRRRGLAIPLDFDPFVSSENAAIVWEDGAYSVQDLQESRNGTTLNFQGIPKGGRRALATGDLIGVGRTLLMFRE